MQQILTLGRSTGSMCASRQRIYERFKLSRDDGRNLRRPISTFFWKSLPLHPLPIAPQILQIVIEPRVLAKDVDDDVDIIDGYPRFPFVPRAVIARETHLLGQFVDLIADAAHLAGAGAGGDDVEVGDG